MDGKSEQRSTAYPDRKAREMLIPLCAICSADQCPCVRILLAPNPSVVSQFPCGPQDRIPRPSVVSSAAAFVRRYRDISARRFAKPRRAGCDFTTASRQGSGALNHPPSPPTHLSAALCLSLFFYPSAPTIGSLSHSTQFPTMHHRTKTVCGRAPSSHKMLGGRSF